MSQRVFVLTLLRTLMHIVGIGMMVSALYYLPLADAIAIAFVMPFMMLLLGHYVLGEEVGMRRMIACAVGFLGTLLIYCAIHLNRTLLASSQRGPPPDGATRHPLNLSVGAEGAHGQTFCGGVQP